MDYVGVEQNIEDRNSYWDRIGRPATEKSRKEKKEREIYEEYLRKSTDPFEIAKMELLSGKKSIQPRGLPKGK